MEVLPVLDVQRSRVVRGVKGNRADYAPLVTPLSPDAQPLNVARGLFDVYAFRKLYVADLDAISGHGRNVHLVPSLSGALRNVEIWLDAGVASRKAARAVLAAPVATLVAGSESVETVSEISDILAEAPDRSVLSLDFRGPEFMGPPALLDDAALWPGRVIVMTLARVGSDEGPDLDRIAGIIARAGRRKVYAAGGVRDRRDLLALKGLGAAGVLVASALHDGKISAGDLKEIAGR